MTTVRTRFAPSPTGFLHVGGVRTNFFAWLQAKKHGGTFILRIEDTDRNRLVPGAIQAIVEDLEWLGLSVDEGPSSEELKLCDPSWESASGFSGDCGPYVQSQRTARYREVAEQLLELGVAYRDKRTAEELEKEKESIASSDAAAWDAARDQEVDPSEEHVIRLKIPRGRKLVLNDAVKGEIVWDEIPLRDPVLLKSDGFPTYHLAVVVDDHDMQVSHIMRGDEWISTAPIHVLLYEALGWEMPVFCHLPPVLGEDGKKLSKRHGSTQLRAFREAGYLPEALLNFLVLLGWSSGDDQEIFTLDEMIEKFSLERVNRAGAIFSYEKLDWMNGTYIRGLSVEDFANRLEPFFTQAGLTINDRDALMAILPLVQERTKLLTDVAPQIEFLFVDTLERDMDAMLSKKVNAETAKKILEACAEALESVDDFRKDSLEATVKPLAEKLDLKVGSIFITLRIAVTGKKATPPLFESIEVLGKERCLARIREAGALLG